MLRYKILRRFLAETRSLDAKWLEGLRKDFLTLLKNTDRVHTYRDLAELRTGINIYRQNFDFIVFERFLNSDLKYKFKLDKDQIQWIDSKLRSPAWNFSSELSVPGPYPDEYRTENQCLTRFQDEKNQWKTKAQRKARDFWKAMQYVVEWYHLNNPIESGMTVDIPEQHTMNIDGFNVILRGYDQGYESETAFAKFKEGLKLYKERAAQVAPILLHKRIPIVLEFEAQLGKGGEYKAHKIVLYTSSVVNQQHKWVAQVLAHEMGHHLWRTYLGKDAQLFWSDTISGDWEAIDLNNLLNKWPDGNVWTFELPEKMHDDPILALQVAAFMQHPENREYNKKEDFQALYEKGTRTLNVPKTPITAYANKSPEESFCETLGLLVAYGPRTLHERVQWWLKTVLPSEIKIASLLIPK